MKNRMIAVACIVLFAVSLLVSLAKGSVAVPLWDLFRPEYAAILKVRLSRIVLGVIAGAGLGIAGVVFQAILRNPLAEPYVLGVSSGAGLGAVIGIFIGVSARFTPFFAFVGALFSIILVYHLAREGTKVPVQSLILTGVIIAILTSGLMVFLVSISTYESLHGILWWLLGSLAVFDIGLQVVVSCLIIAGSIVVFIFARDMNAISIGEEEAIHLGIDIETVKKVLFFVGSLITAGIVCAAGIIPFVGLIIPHMMRSIVGPNHKVLIPATAVGGACFLILCDTVSRSILPPTEIPIGVITSLVGGPIFIALLRKRQRVR